MQDTSAQQVKSEDTFRLLTVCTGNICRSPLCESLFRNQVSSILNLTIASAGLHAVVGAPMDHDAARQLIELGGDPTDLVGEQLTDRHVAASNLILTMTLGQRNELVKKHPRATRRTFSVGEFYLLLQGIREPASLAELVKAASLNRSRSGVTTTHDVEDPYRKSVEVHRRVALQISEYVTSITSKIC
ncbi:arsenate reductase/protein-tyrosine-phosphatase family protein [Glutamicibacter arilaitensis]|uniref:arsenate reductase/protein-tyrosine-phosphatase family protein n=1 Tax=Glutamicibacter arilaitensis TaxID=256701 RepID=UPI003FD27EC1